ncbi:unnamed protein product [Closterium sp. NIES-64]|nr:unnamed protein product [Closterium sp. NIES-64]
MLRPRQGRCDRSTVARDAAEWVETQEELQALLADPLLADVAADVSLEEVETLIAVETGGGMRLRVRRLDGGEYGGEVEGGGQADEGGGKQNVVLEEEGEMEEDNDEEEKEREGEEEECGGQSRDGHVYAVPSHSRGISWRYIWSHACLAVDGHPLPFHSPTTPLLDLGLTNGDQPPLPCLSFPLELRVHHISLFRMAHCSHPVPLSPRFSPPSHH